jgi:hypothetical protein
MKPFSHFQSTSPVIAAAVAMFSLVSLNAQSAPQPVPVAPAAPASQRAPQEDILDIRPPIHIPAPFPWLAWSGGALVAAGFGLGVWKLLRRPRRRLAYEIALENLEKARPLMRADDAQPFSLAVSEIVRCFIEEMLPVRAAHRTTNEFLHDLTNLSNSPLASHRYTLSNFLGHCDLAKFARWMLTVPQMEAMLESARRFVIDLGQPKPATRQPANRTAPQTPGTNLVAASS